MRAYRDGRRDQAQAAYRGRLGACTWTSEWITETFGDARAGGRYLPIGDERHAGIHVVHLWNLLPDGRILDATADQFDGNPAVRIRSADDERHLGGCPGVRCNGALGPL